MVLNSARPLPARAAIALTLAILALLATTFSDAAGAAFAPGHNKSTIDASPPLKAIPYGRSKLLVLARFGGEIIRVSGDGTLDRSFGRGGQLEFGAIDIAVDRQGRILVLEPPWKRDNRPSVTRLLPDGSVDASFGRGGTVSVELGDAYSSVESITLDAEGRLLIHGGVSGVNTGRGPFAAQLAVTRLRPDGSVDSSFGVEGVALLPIARIEGLTGGVALGPGGGIFVLLAEGRVFKLSPDGVLRRPYGSDGEVVLDDFVDQLPGVKHLALSESIAVTDRGEVVLAGTVSFPGDDGGGDSSAVGLRIRANGSLDDDFGRNGFAWAKIGEASSGRSLLLQRSGRLLIVGTANGRDIAAAGFTPGGRHARSFGRGGGMRIQFGGVAARGEAIVPRPPGRAILVGSVGRRGPSRLALARVPMVSKHR